MLTAQDRRTVMEPRWPLPCTTLRAHLTAQNGRLPLQDEARLDTERIQHAIDACSPGRAVELRSGRSGNIFLTGPLKLRAGVTLLIEKKTELYASRNPRLYDLAPGSCGVVDEKGHGCQPLILADHAPGSAVMGEGVIDGRGGEALLGQHLTWWDLAQEAKVTDRQQSCMRLVVVRHSAGFVLYRITLRNAPNFHVFVQQTNGFTAWGVKIDTPATARNTDGIDPASSTNVSILYSFIRDGDDDVAIKAGRLGPATHMTIAHNHFYSGHGMSIGSETNGGVSAIQVSDLTLDGTTNGIRIKSDRSRGGLVRDVAYRDVCMRDVRNPILLTPRYSPRGGSLIPEYRGITLSNVHVLSPGRVDIEGLDSAHSTEVNLDNVFLDGVAPSAVHVAFARFTLGPHIGNLRPSGPGVSLTDAVDSHPGQPYRCDGRMVPFPTGDSASP